MVALLALVAASAGLLLLPRSDDGLLGLPELTLGEVSPRTVKSPTTLVVEDHETTEKARAQAATKVPPTYDELLWMGDTIKQRIEIAFAAGRDTGEGEAEEGPRAEAFMLELGVAVEPAQVLPLLRGANGDELRDAMIMVAQTVYEAPVVQDRPYLALQLSPQGVAVRTVDRDGSVQREATLHTVQDVLGIDQARAAVDTIVAERLERLEPAQRRAVAGVLKKLLKPNLVPNDAETERRREERAKAVHPVVIALETGSPILRAGDVVTRQHLLMLAGLNQALEAQSRLQAGAGSALMMVFLVVFAYRVARRSYRPRPRQRDLAFLASMFVVTLLIFWVGFKGVDYVADRLPGVGASPVRLALPVAFGAIMIRLVAGVEAAAVFSPVVGLAGGWMMEGSLAFAAYTTLGSLAAASTADGRRPRGLLWAAGVRVALGQGVGVCALALLGSRFDAAALGPELGAALVSALAATLPAAVVLPLVELLFGFTTAHRLGDLANLNHPLLRDLLVEAPGTYHHSILVGTLAEAGAEAVGASPLLARVGGYYHDIGKLKNPRLYDENDAEAFPGLLPMDHARALREHVADGLELASKHRLGAPILEIIAQHHGTGLVRAPYQRALQHGGPPDPDLFRYPGPRPVSREGALVLLADVVETATRPLGHEVGLTRARIDLRVRHVITEVLEDGQLDQSDITLRDLSRVVAAFTTVLEERLLRRGRPPTLSTLPVLSGTPLVRPPPRGEPN
jgi:putative nucleotidyltransferase with HDIG domain